MDIQRYLNDEAVVACPPTPGYRFGKFARRHQAALIATGLVAAALIAGIVGITWQAIRAIQERNRANFAERLATDRLAQVASERDRAVVAEELAEERLRRARRAEEQIGEEKRKVEETLKQEQILREEAEQQKKQAQWNAYVAQLRALSNEWRAGEFGQLDYLLERMVPNASQFDFRHWEWFYLRDQVDQRRQKLGPQVRSAAWSADGQILASAGEVLEIREAATLKVLQTLGPKRGWSHVALSSDASRVAGAAADGSIQVWDVAAGRLVREHPGGRFSVQAFDLSPDGRQLCVGCGRPKGQVLIWDLEQDDEMRSLYPGTVDSYVGNVHWHPRQPWLASSHRDGKVRVWDVASGELRWEREACQIACFCAGGARTAST